MYEFIDAHIHLADDSFNHLLSTIHNSLISTNTIVFSMSTNLNSSKQTLELSSKIKNVIPFVGIHPDSAKESDLAKFIEFLNKMRKFNYGIGEIGLDESYSKEKSEYSIQKYVFSEMLDLAEERRKPVSIHSRNSIKDVIDILSSYNLVSVLLHWFSSDEYDLKVAEDMGYYVSFGPPILYSKKIKKLVKKSPVEMILIETDGPISYGACFEGKQALPSLIPTLILELSKIKDCSYKETSDIIYTNSKKYLNFDLD